MAEYLELEKVLDDKNIITVQTKEYGSIDVIPVDTITDIELSDVQPMKRGKWLKRMSTSDSCKCSVCGNSHEYPTIYCPNCGADMRGDAE